jgi:hypothetical protein
MGKGKKRSSNITKKGKVYRMKVMINNCEGKQNTI